MRKSLLLLLTFVIMPLSALAAEVQAIRSWSAPDNTRLVFDITAPLKHQLFALESPDRLVIDLKNSRFSGKSPQPVAADGFITGMRTGLRGGSDLRVVLDLQPQVK